VHKGKLLPPVYVLLALCAAYLLHKFWPLATAIPTPWNYIGLMLVLAGIAMILSPAITFNARGTAIKPFDEATVLVQDGLYSHSRNPIYLGMVILVLGVAMLLGSATAFIAPMALAVVLQLLFIRVEERMLAARFGSEYSAYKARVRRWL
jgi:protein-S-isoprenylcysteine O-methyltransferase Ste14